MLSKTRGIILRTVRYSDTNMIVTVYTEEYGMLGFHVPGAAKGKGSIKPSHLLPLNLVDMVIYYNPVKNLNRIRELKCNPPLHHLHQDLKKRSVGMFILELLNKAFREEEKNPALYRFLHHSIELLEHDDNIDFVPWFMIQLTRYFGCEPDTSTYSDGLLLDIHNGRFVLPDKMNPNLLSADDSKLIYGFLNSGYEQLRDAKHSYRQRISVIQGLMTYCRAHISEHLTANSLGVLHEVMIT